jgi:hypothetical protein
MKISTPLRLFGAWMTGRFQQLAFWRSNPSNDCSKFSIPSPEPQSRSAAQSSAPRMLSGSRAPQAIHASAGASMVYQMQNLNTNIRSESASRAISLLPIPTNRNAFFMKTGLRNMIARAIFALLILCTSTGTAFSQIAQRGTATSGTSTNSTLTIAKPTGVVAGDLLIANAAMGANVGVTFGFTVTVSVAVVAH